MSFGVTEMLAVLGVVIALFGVGKLPTVMGDLAKGIRSFRAGLKDEPGEAEGDAASADAASARTAEPARLPRPVEGPSSTSS